jgi:hypothetical protein
VDERAGVPLPGPLLAGFALSCVGGPLALAALYLPDAAGAGGIGSLGFLTAAGAALFAAPLLVWWRFSAEISSAGGLYAFVEAAAGRRVALLQGATWTLSYFLYLPYTVTELVYDQVPATYPGVRPYQKIAELAVPALLASALILRERLVFVIVAAAAVAQVVLLAVFAGVVAHHAGAHAGALRPHGAARPLAGGAANISLLFVCASLPLFLGGEVAGGGRALRRIIVVAVAVVAALTLAAAVPMASLGRGLAAAPLPGYGLATISAGAGFGDAVAVGSIASVAGLIVAEYIVLTRLLPVMTGLSRRRAVVAIGIAFIVADALSLIDPERAYEYALTPALVALYASQAIVFLAYLRFRRSPLDLAAAGVATALAGYGLWVAVAQQPYT